MNTAGQAGGFVCTVLFGYLVKAFGDYDVPIFVIAGMVMISQLPHLLFQYFSFYF
jgi:hypothetical protein